MKNIHNTIRNSYHSLIMVFRIDGKVNKISIRFYGLTLHFCILIGAP